MVGRIWGRLDRDLETLWYSLASYHAPTVSTGQQANPSSGHQPTISSKLVNRLERIYCSIKITKYDLIIGDWRERAKRGNSRIVSQAGFSKLPRRIGQGGEKVWPSRLTNRKGKSVCYIGGGTILCHSGNTIRYCRTRPNITPNLGSHP